MWWIVEEDTASIEDIPADDPLFSAPTVSIGEPVHEEDIDDVLYGEVES